MSLAGFYKMHFKLRPVACVILLVSCSHRPEHVLGKKDSGKTVNMMMGESARIELDQCQGCEESWKVYSGWPGCLVMTRDEFEPNCKDCNGGGGKRSVTFEAHDACEADLALAYYGDTVRFHLHIVGKK